MTCTNINKYIKQVKKVYYVYYPLNMCVQYTHIHENV